MPDRVDAPRALPRLLLGQVAAHQRVNVLLEAGKMPLAADEVGHLQNDLLDICVVKEKHGRLASAITDCGSSLKYAVFTIRLAMP